VPGVRSNLLSVGKFADLGHVVLFNSTQCLIFDKDDLDSVYLRAHRDKNSKLYRLQGKSVYHDLPSNAAMLSSSISHDPQVDLIHPSIPATSSNPQPPVVPKSRRLTPGEIDLWHKRIGHVNFQSLYHMTTRGLVCGVPHVPHVKRICESCILGKHHRDKFPKRRTTETKRILELVHTDICGPLPITSRNHNRYILTFVDDFSRKCWLYFLSEKSQTLDKFKEFKALVETPQQKIKCLRSD
jgi:hypothetical protein